VGIAIDILVVLFLLWSVLRGWRFGFLYQVGHLAMLVVAYFASRGLATLFEKPIAKMLGLDPWLASTVAFFAFFIVIGVIGAIVVRKITRDLIPDTSALTYPNRTLGAAASLGKGVLITYLALVMLIQVQRITAKTPVPWQSSHAARFVASRNFLDRTPLGRLAKLGWIFLKNDPETLAREPRMAILVTHPKAQKLLSADLLAAARTNDFVALLQNEALWDYLGEAEIKEALDSFDWVEASDLAARAEKKEPGKTK
jgi:uncharacterized membrane protein required for colicin V production